TLWLFTFKNLAHTLICTLSLHDALPICKAHGQDLFCFQQMAQICARIAAADRTVALRVYRAVVALIFFVFQIDNARPCIEMSMTDRKSTRLNSSHVSISYAVFCLKKKKN